MHSVRRHRTSGTWAAKVAGWRMTADIRERLEAFARSVTARVAEDERRAADAKRRLDDAESAYRDAIAAVSAGKLLESHLGVILSEIEREG